MFTSGGKPGLHFSYERYLLNRLREEFDFFATPLRIVEKHKKLTQRRKERIAAKRSTNKHTKCKPPITVSRSKLRTARRGRVC